MKVNQKLVSEFQNEAAAQYPKEACGLVVKKGKKQQFVPCVNSATNPKERFRIGIEERQRAEDLGEVVAVWHSHPDLPNIPSEFDVVECEESELPWFITAVTKSEEGEFFFSETSLTEPSGFKMDYIGRPYYYGLVDCYSLLVDYYKGEFGIELQRAPELRNTRFWEVDEPVCEQNYERLGFERVYDEEPVKGDVFLIQTGGNVANHVAIYIGEDMILHHCEDRLSGRSVYGGYWHKHTIAHLRHPEFDKNGADKGNS